MIKQGPNVDWTKEPPDPVSTLKYPPLAVASQFYLQNFQLLNWHAIKGNLSLGSGKLALCLLKHPELMIKQDKKGFYFLYAKYQHI